MEHSTQTEPEHFEQNDEIDVQLAIEHEPLESVKPWEQEVQVVEFWQT